MRLTAGVAEQIREAYLAMERAGYRPAAPSDGFGHITVPLEQLDLEREIDTFTQMWWRQEERCTFWIGCADFPARVAMILCVETARLLCTGRVVRPLARKLLRLALKALDRAIAED